MNKDLVLREYLAIERTKLANERTLLTYVRTSLYFMVAGSTLGAVIDTPFWNAVGMPLIVTGGVIVLVGVWRFVRVTRHIRRSQKHVGNVSLEFVHRIRGEEIA